MLDEAAGQGVNDENLTELDLTEIRKLHDELVAVVADFDAATADNDQLVKESLSNSRPFDGLLDGLIDALEWMMKQAESGQLPDMSGSGAPLGSLGHFSYVLGQCIDRYNSVFVEKEKNLKRQQKQLKFYEISADIQYNINMCYP